jgi:peptidoglycan/xylan/chitin deacetylase (PgdA/CDA1 family)
MDKPGLPRLARAVVGPPVVRAIGSLRAAVTTEPVVALTFDDGPVPDGTRRVLDLLAEHEARATFFVLADRVETQAELALRIGAEGHEIGLHGVGHRRLTQCSRSEVLEAIRAGRKRLEAVIGKPVRLFRPPYGAQSAFSYAVARLCGMTVVGWSVDSLDWDEEAGESTIADVVARVRPGDIVLLHDTLVPLPDHPLVAQQLLDRFSSEGMRGVTVSEMVSTGRAVRSRWFEA